MNERYAYRYQRRQRAKKGGDRLEPFPGVQPQPPTVGAEIGHLLGRFTDLLRQQERGAAAPREAEPTEHGRLAVRWHAALAAEPHRWHLDLLEQLDRLAAARAAVHQGPAEALAAAEAAHAALGRWRVPPALRPLRVDLEAEALGRVANAERLAERYDEAAALFRRARRRARAGSGDPLVEARLGSLEASLAIEHRQFEAARALLERSGALAHREGVRPEAACALLQLGRVHYYEGDFLPSFVAYHRGLSLLDPRNPRQEGDRLAGLGGMGWALEGLGYPTLAMRFAEMYIARAHEGGFPSLALRGRWLLGRVLISAGGAEHAVPRLDSVRERFLADGLTLDAALVSLDLAWACSQVPGGGHRQHQLAREALPVLERHELPAEVERAVELWAHATLEGRSNRAFLESLRHDIAHLLRGVAPRRAVG